MTVYEDKLQREREWYTNHGFRQDHVLNSRLFWSERRNSFNYVFPKNRLASLIRQAMRRSGLANPRMLVAPVGSGDDLKYLTPLSTDIAGIDISAEAVGQIQEPAVARHVGDMKHMTMFPDGHFDMVVVPLFFHHYMKYGVGEFLRELHRVLKPGGHLFSLEPSILNPVSCAARLIKRFVGNISGHLEDEAPFVPTRLAAAMRECGFRDVRVCGASFTHCRTPIFLARIHNVLTFPLLKVPPLKYFAWQCLFYGRK